MAAEREVTTPPQQNRWDFLVGELHQLREQAGTPSYEAMTRRLIAQRIDAGQDEHAARIAKSSLHDAFRFGRSRINQELVTELVRMLGGDTAAVNEWVKTCTTPLPTTPRSIPEPAETGSAEIEPVAPPRATQQLLLVVGCIALNLVGREFVDFFNLPIYLDMMGTAIAAIALGPWRGAAVGASTNLLGVIGSGWVSLPFALVNVVGALLWGYGVRRWGMGRTILRFFTLNVITAMACSLVAVPIILAFLNPDLRVGNDAITLAVSDSIDGFVAAVTFSNLVTSLGDKLVSGFVALVALSSLPLAFRHDLDLLR